ncbi:MAG: tRNA (guanine(10)-N(2))-dimethyltransferase [Candidatus Micrarchaeia archaeon]
MEIIEGKTRIRINDEVFYNPEMKLCRDISTLLLKALNKNYSSVLDLTSATGIRGIRYMKEVGIEKGVFVDINKKACTLTKQNLRINKLNGKVINLPIHELKLKEKFDVIDLDPFGTPVPYLDYIFQFAKDKSIIFVTATDTAVLFGAQQKACLKNYGSYTLHNEFQNEVGTRILIYRIVRSASESNFGIRVIFALAKRHYVRIMLELKKGAEEAYLTNKKIGYISYCYKCLERSFSKFGKEYCSKKHKLENAGPLWLGNLFDKKVIKKAIAFAKKEENKEAEKILETAYEELELPFYYNLHYLAKRLKKKIPRNKEMIEKLKEKNFDASQTIFCPYGIKTNAGINEIISCF